MQYKTIIIILKKQWNEQRTQTRSTLEKKYKWLNKYEKMVNLIILESNLK